METILSFSTISIRTLSMAYPFARITALIDYWLESDIDFSATVIKATHGAGQFDREVVWEANSVIADYEIQIFVISLRQTNSNFTVKRVGKCVLQRIRNELVYYERARYGGIDIERDRIDFDLQSNVSLAAFIRSQQ